MELLGVILSGVSLMLVVYFNWKQQSDREKRNLPCFRANWKANIALAAITWVSFSLFIVR